MNTRRRFLAGLVGAVAGVPVMRTCFGRNKQLENSSSKKLYYFPLHNIVPGSHVQICRGTIEPRLTQDDIPMSEWVKECDGVIFDCVVGDTACFTHVPPGIYMLRVKEPGREWEWSIKFKVQDEYWPCERPLDSRWR